MSKDTKYICIHGHFYQPPRENPWLNTVEIQDSAYPYHDWNERINAESYARNSASRILNNDGNVIDIINNYAWISFNFGPTLMQWMKEKAPGTYEAIIEADKMSRKHFSGHGPALAQAFNHMIMPLANDRDRETQVIWGIEDFKSRFGREPEGMWLGETAVNTEVLESLARHGIKFTILSPYQAKAFRKIGDKEWKNAEGAKIDPKRAYRCNLPSGNSIALFFYDGPASQGVAFEGLLNNGGNFARRLTGQLARQEEPQLVHIATDGESYGHHHRLGEMALSYCIHSIKQNPNVRLSIYAEFLEANPPQYEAQILENTSWSCAHGVERWRSDCGCNTGGHPNWNQKWRKPLREAFDWVRDQLIDLYETEMEAYHGDPWELRNSYISVVLDRSRDNVESFLETHFGTELHREDKVKILKLLEMQYHCMLMYTSCGWFFDEVTGIESMQDVMYASRAIQLAAEVSGKELEEGFVDLLEKTPSNIKSYGTAAEAYRKHVKNTIVDLQRVGAHFAVSSLFQSFPEEVSLYSFNARFEKRKFFEAGKQKLVMGRIRLHSEVTLEEADFSYAVVYLGEHHLVGGIRPFDSPEAMAEAHEVIADAFLKSRIYDLYHLVDKHYQTHNYSFWHLFRDEQRKIIEMVMEGAVRNTEGALDQLYQNNYPLLQVFDELNMKPAPQLKVPVDLAVNSRLKKLLEHEPVQLKELKNIFHLAQRVTVELDEVTLSFLASERLNKMVHDLEGDAENVERLSYIVSFLNIMREAGLSPEYWEAQNTAFRIKQNKYGEYQDRCELGDGDAESWCRLFSEFYQNIDLVLA